jgi:hypothetical protein
MVTACSLAIMKGNTHAGSVTQGVRASRINTTFTHRPRRPVPSHVPIPYKRAASLRG